MECFCTSMMTKNSKFSIDPWEKVVELMSYSSRMSTCRQCHSSHSRTKAQKWKRFTFCRWSQPFKYFWLVTCAAKWELGSSIQLDDVRHTRFLWQLLWTYHTPPACGNCALYLCSYIQHNVIFRVTRFIHRGLWIKYNSSLLCHISKHIFQK